MEEISKDISDAIDQAVFEEIAPDALALAIKKEFSEIIAGKLNANNPMESQQMIHRLVESMRSGEEDD